LVGFVQPNIRWNTLSLPAQPPRFYPVAIRFHSILELALSFRQLTLAYADLSTVGGLAAGTFQLIGHKRPKSLLDFMLLVRYNVAQ
jgi:hypothetical protein